MGLALVPGELTPAHGILWEGAVAVPRSIRTQVVSGFRVKAQLLVVLEQRAGAALVAELA